MTVRLLAALSLLVGSCTPQPEGDLRVLVAGCRVVEHGQACEVEPEGALVLWVEGVDSPEVRLAAARLDVAVASTTGGSRVTWTADGRHGMLTVRGAGRAFRMQLVPAHTPGWQDELDTIRREGDVEACAERVHEALPDAADAERGALWWHLAGCALDAGERDEATHHIERALQAFELSGRTTDAVDARCALGALLYGEPGGAERARELLADPAGETWSAEVAWSLAYHEALLDRRTGRYRAALGGAGRAEAIGSRFGLPELFQTARSLKATILAEMGDFSGAVAVQQVVTTAMPLEPPACGRTIADAHTALAWFELMVARSQGTPPPPETRARLLEVRALQERCGATARAVANVEVNLALDRLLAGDHGAATLHLENAREAQRRPDPHYEAWAAEVEGRVALGRGDATAALESFERALAVARQRVAPAKRAQALFGRADARWALGVRDAAIADLEAAHDALWEASPHVTLEAGAAGFLAARGAITRRLVSRLLEVGRPEDALAYVRAARSHGLRATDLTTRVEALGPEAARRWEHSVEAHRAARRALEEAVASGWTVSTEDLEAHRATLDALESRADALLDAAIADLGGSSGSPLATLPPVRDGELLLAWFPAEEGWVGFALTGESLVTLPLGDLPRDRVALGERLFRPILPAVEAADRVVLLPWGPLREVGLHTLPVDGAPLIAYTSVVYGLDRAPESRSPPTSERLVVADPRSDLPGARREAEVIRRGWSGGRLLLGSEATVHSVRTALEGLERFHYAGHGRFDGEEAWDAGLVLADGVLGLGEVLTLARPPREVVLSACDSGRAPEGPLENWGVAQAFVTAGSAVVLATTRPVSDDSSLRVAEVLGESPGPLEMAARKAILSLVAAGDDSADAWRILVP